MIYIDSVFSSASQFSKNYNFHTDKIIFGLKYNCANTARLDLDFLLPIMHLKF